jgi:hypothetical protein
MEMREMADWRKMAMAAILADGAVDESEVALLKRELKGADGKIDEEGLKFLIELRVAAHKKAKSAGATVNEVFEKFFSKTVHDHVLKDGKVDAAGAAWLKTHLFADSKKVDEGQAAILASINKKAKTKHADFEKLHTDLESHRAKAAKK